MSVNQIQCQPAYVLHQLSYRESSLLIEVFTRDFGRISILAKGVRKPKSKYAAILRPFQLLSLSFLGRTDLKTLSGAEAVGNTLSLNGLALYCGYYVNELIQYFLHKYDPYPEVFVDYQQCLDALAQQSDIEATLRQFEFNLMEKIGYGVHCGYDAKHQKDIDSTKKYRFNIEYGLIEDSQGVFTGSSLLAMQKRDFLTQPVRNEAKLLMRLVIDGHLHGKPLKSRLIINDIIKRLNNEQTSRITRR